MTVSIIDLAYKY